MSITIPDDWFDLQYTESELSALLQSKDVNWTRDQFGFYVFAGLGERFAWLSLDGKIKGSPKWFHKQ